MERIPVAGPWITQKEIDYVSDAVSNAWYSNANMYHTRFEQAFTNYIGVRFAVALPSCTSAIHLALLALGVGPGDEVIVPDITWIASTAPISYVGATPVFADVDQKTWCLDMESFKASITTRTKAVIAVDLYGGMPELEVIRSIAQQHGVAVIEDAAEAIGSEYHGQKAGSLGDISTFSFHGSKTLTTGEGGMLATNHEDIYQRVLFLRDHGRQPGHRLFFNSEVAYKYRMSSMQAALGLAQLERIEELIEHKRRTFDWYAANLADIKEITLNNELPGTKNSYWMVTIIMAEELGLTKEQLMSLLNERAIDCRPFFYPLSSLPAYAHLPQAAQAKRCNKISYQLSAHGVNLPSSLSMTEKKVVYVCNTLKEIFQRAGK